MRKSLCACVASSVLVLAGQAHAEAPAGYVDVAYGEADVEGVDTDTFSIGGSVAASGGGRYSAQTWGAQADLRVRSTEILDEDATVTEFGGHLFGRSQSGLIGAYIGYAQADSDLGEGDAWTAGVEGLNYYDYVTLYGSMGYVELNELDADGWNGAVELRYFLEPNLRFDLGGSVLNGDILAEEGTLWTVGFGVEYQLPDMPVSVFGAFDHAEFDNDVVDFSSDLVSIGLRWNFNGNLLTRDRSGPALPPAARITRTLSGL